LKLYDTNNKGNKMKKTIFLTLILTLLLAACGGSSEADVSIEDGEQFDPNSFELPLSSTLAIGTLKLEETDQGIVPDQAADLLPLWQVLNSLTNSDTAAPEEINAVIEQIQEMMTPEQMAAIEAMELTGEDIMDTMHELGLTTRQSNAEGGSAPAEGPGRGQGPSSGPGGGLGGQELSPEQIATAQARRAEGSGGGSRMLAPLVPAVIELLEEKVN
jgi:hypothetical protein